MSVQIAQRMSRMAPSGIRKVNEKALAMERAGETVYHFEIGRSDFDTPAYVNLSTRIQDADGASRPLRGTALQVIRPSAAQKPLGPEPV